MNSYVESVCQEFLPGSTVALETNSIEDSIILRLLRVSSRHNTH
jgi:hypothetical protein